MKKKKIFEGLFVSIILFCSTSMWAYDFEADNIQYTIISLDELTAEVSGLTNKNVTEVIIPETVEYQNRSLSIVSMADAVFSGNKKLKSISIPNTIAEISKQAFYNCTSLTQVLLPYSLTTIGKEAFSGCSSLSEISLPEELQTIGTSAFSGCSSLTDLSLPEGIQSIGDKAFQSCGFTTFTWPEAVTSIPSYCFSSCESLANISLPNSLLSIELYAFKGCSSLRELNIPNSVTSIHHSILDGCKNLKSLQIGTGLTSVVDAGGSSNGVFSVSPLFSYYGIPSDMKIILKDTPTYFRVGGDITANYNDYRNITHSGEPLFSNIVVNHYYVGRPLKDIKSWNYDGNTYGYAASLWITVEQPYGTIDTLEIGGYCTDVPYFYQTVENLILGENIETYTVSNIYQGKLKSIKCMTMTPPLLSGSFDDNIYLNCILYVPIGSEELYSTTEGWKDFWNIQEYDDPLLDLISDIESARKQLEEVLNYIIENYTDIVYMIITSYNTLSNELLEIYDLLKDYYFSDNITDENIDELRRRIEEVKMEIEELLEKAEQAETEYLYTALGNEIGSVKTTLNDTWNIIITSYSDVANDYYDEYNSIVDDLTKLLDELDETYNNGILNRELAEEMRDKLKEIKQRIEDLLATAKNAHDVAGIDNININSLEIEDIFSISGQKTTAPQKGVNIVRYSDGATRKVLVQ